MFRVKFIFSDETGQNYLAGSLFSNSFVPGNELEPVLHLVIWYWSFGINVDKNNADVTNPAPQLRAFILKFLLEAFEIIWDVTSLASVFLAVSIIDFT